MHSRRLKITKGILFKDADGLVSANQLEEAMRGHFQKVHWKKKNEQTESY